MLNAIAGMIQSNPAGTLGHMVLVVAGFYLVFGVMRLAAASTEKRDINKGSGSNGWIIS